MRVTFVVARFFVSCSIFGRKKRKNTTKKTTIRQLAEFLAALSVKTLLKMEQIENKVKKALAIIVIRE